MTSTSYPSSEEDWRGGFIRSMVEALAKRSDVSLTAWNPPGPAPDAVRKAMTEGDSAWLETLSRRGGIAQQLRHGRLGAVTMPIQLLCRLRDLYRREPSHDVIHANWLQLALPLGRDRRPLLCTALGTDMQLLKVPGMVTLLRRVFSGRPTAICPNADWMVPILEKHFSDSATIRCVPFGIDESYFSIRRAPPAKPRWLCVSRVTRGKIGDLIEWGRPLFEGHARELHLLGPMQDDITLPSWIHHHGATNPRALAEEWLPGATGLISLSRHPEGRPQIMLEALAAGIPVLASDLPAHRELLEKSGGGLLAGRAQDLGPHLHRLEGEEGLRIGFEGRAWVLRDIGTWDTCGERFATIYRELLRE